VLRTIADEVHDAGGIEELLAALGYSDETDEQVRLRLGFDRAEVRELHGVRRLQLALIELAIKDVLAPEKRTPVEELEESRVWLLCTYDSHPAGDVATFDGCCESLGIDADALRERVFQMQAAGLRPRLNFAALGENTRKRFRKGNGRP
jgi:hypothetical protein